MSEAGTPAVGSIGWVDLTVDDAEELRDFYSAVVGYGTSAVDMGGYSDYCLVPPGSSAPVAGVCHARGMNKDMPPVWLIYLIVADLDRSVAACKERGGTVVVPLRAMGNARFCVVRDPAGAIAGLYQAGPR